jgi:hypothetical protein
LKNHGTKKWKIQNTFHKPNRPKNTINHEHQGAYGIQPMDKEIHQEEKTLEGSFKYATEKRSHKVLSDSDMHVRSKVIPL